MLSRRAVVRNWMHVGADILWIFALMVYVLAGTSLVPFHADESTQIMMSRDYHYQFIAGDWDRVLYHDPPLNETEQQLRLLNGTLPKYLMGLAWYASGYSVDDLNDQWLWGAGWEWNVANGHMPSDGLLLAARWSAAVLGALSIPLMFALGWLWGRRWTAYPASFLLATHPVILIHVRRAQMEAALLFFSLVVITAAVWWARDIRETRTGLWRASGLVLALGAGLAVASKHSGVVPVAAAYAGLLVVIFVRRRTARAGSALALLALAGMVAMGTFFALNPAWWGDILGRPAEVLALRAGLVADQIAAFPDSAYADGTARLAGMLRQLSIAPPAYYEVPGWQAYIGGEIDAYEASAWTGIRYGDGWLAAGLGAAVSVLALLGAARLGVSVQNRPDLLIVMLWGLLTALFILGAVPLAWQRYYMPLYPIEMLLAGAGVGWLGARIKHRERT